MAALCSADLAKVSSRRSLALLSSSCTDNSCGMDIATPVSSPAIPYPLLSHSSRFLSSLCPSVIFLSKAFSSFRCPHPSPPPSPDIILLPCHLHVIALTNPLLPLQLLRQPLGADLLLEGIVLLPEPCVSRLLLLHPQLRSLKLHPSLPQVHSCLARGPPWSRQRCKSDEGETSEEKRSGKGWLRGCQRKERHIGTGGEQRNSGHGGIEAGREKQRDFWKGCSPEDESP